MTSVSEAFFAVLALVIDFQSSVPTVTKSQKVQYTIPNVDPRTSNKPVIYVSQLLFRTHYFIYTSIHNISMLEVSLLPYVQPELPFSFELFE